MPRLACLAALVFLSACAGDHDPEPNTYAASKGASTESQPLAPGPSTTPEEPLARPAAPEAPPESAVEPTAPPASTTVDRDDHVDFALDFLGRQAYNSVPGLMELYANRVRYFDQGTIARGAVATDKASYFERWPNRYYELAGPVRATGGESPAVRFEYDFAVSHADASGEREGRAWVELGIVLAGDGYGYLITSERGGTY